MRLAVEKLRDLSRKLEQFEASESRARTGTGARREGEQFEGLIQEWWEAVVDSLVDLGARKVAMMDPLGRRYARLQRGKRSLYLPDRRKDNILIEIGANENRAAWFERTFQVKDLVRAYPGEKQAIDRYAPAKGPFAGDRYPRMYAGMTTKFDGTLVLEENGVLKEKVLLEYKTAKSSKRRQIDGNAHERLSFQMLQYLEVATRYPRCSLVVWTNGAFARYRNKYHVNFHVQADRLTNFAWFHMEYVCTEPEYLDYAVRLGDWIAQG